MAVALQHGIWLAVCDGKKALLLENQGEIDQPKLENRGVFEQDNPPAHDQGSAPPGRAFASVGNRRGAMEQTDFHEEAERNFLRAFARTIAERVEKHVIRKLILIAPARALGLMRKSLPPSVHQVLVGELDRDYAHLPLYEIERHLLRAEL